MHGGERKRSRAAWTLLALLPLILTAACQDASDWAERPGALPLPTSGAPTPGVATASPSSGPASTTTTPLHPGVGITLLPGADGKLPVTVRWAVELEIVEAIAVDDDRLYATHETLEAFDLRSGLSMWTVENPDMNAWMSDGGDVIGRDRQGNVWAHSPWNSAWIVDAENGTALTYRAPKSDGGAEPGAGFEPFDAEPVTGVVLEAEQLRSDVTTPEGKVLFSIVEDEGIGYMGPLQPIVAGEGIALVTGTGLLLVLDPIGGAWAPTT